MKTCIITTDTYQNHDTGIGHPERIDRVTVVNEGLKRIQSKDLIWLKPKLFDAKYLSLAHSEEYLHTLEKSFPSEGNLFLDGDTLVGPGSKQAALDAVASVITAIDGVINKDFINAFCSIRPPGHHAESRKAMGFCIYNNVAIGAHYLLDKYKLKKVAIIDFDVHHGNGTQEIFYDNKQVLYISSHQYPFYPGTGSEKETGNYNNILNVPLDAGTSGNIFLNAYEPIFKKIIEFKPEFILLSSGFDAHINDPLAQINLQSTDFAELTNRILKIAKEVCNNKLVSVLEGGYDLQALQESSSLHVQSLLKV
ncbi:MAG: histone deacetylase family protein [Proteobacteria bacterium]|nr:histone deacetylase family protein [Pseudomonadota bacterium]MDA0995825.1 histone deacetylase family protein [Pseudomonadota bacterium]